MGGYLEETMFWILLFIFLPLYTMDPKSDDELKDFVCLECSEDFEVIEKDLNLNNLLIQFFDSFSFIEVTDEATNKTKRHSW